MYQNCGIVWCLIVMGTFVIKCDARHGIEHTLHQIKDKSISCYECNSEYDPRCADPFDPYTIGVVNCSKKRPLDHIKWKPTLCRKTVQRIEGRTRIIRGCGYIPDKRDDKECMVRTGTHDVHVQYCSCTRSLCNSGLQVHPSRLILGIIILATTRLKLIA